MNTPNKTEERIKKILKNFDLQESDPVFSTELKNALAAREYGLSFKKIEKMIEERLSNYGI